MQNVILEPFSGEEPNKSINIGEAVAFGAVVQAAIFIGEWSSHVERHFVALGFRDHRRFHDHRR